ALPFSFAAFSGALQRIENAIRIGNLIERGRAFGAVASAASRILRIAFELLNRSRDFVDVREQPTRRLAVETGRRHKLITPLLTSRPCLRIQLSPIIPAFFWWKRREMDARRPGVRCVGFFFHVV